MVVGGSEGAARPGGGGGRGGAERRRVPHDAVLYDADGTDGFRAYRCRREGIQRLIRGSGFRAPTTPSHD